MNRFRRSTGPRERGFALLAALGLAVAIALVAAAVVRDGRATARIAANAVAAAEARAAAEAGLWRAASLWAAGAQGAFAPWRFEGLDVATSGKTPALLTDLNRATRDALAETAAAAAHPDPEAFAEAVTARREALDAAGVPWRLNARAFDAVEDARALAPGAVWPKLAAALTTHGGAPRDGTRAVRIRSEAGRPEGARAAIEAVIAVDAEGRLAPLSWRAVRPASLTDAPR